MSLLEKASMVMTPNAIKESKVYSIIPSNGNGNLIFTRGGVTSGVTLTNSDGLIESVPYNLVLKSEEFNDSNWTKFALTITPNSINSPNKTLTADTLIGDGSTNVHLIQQNGSSTSGITYTTSVFAKKGTNNFIQLIGPLAAYTSGTVFANFDLNNGVVGSLGGGATSSITNIGNGWYRCTMTATANATTTSSQVQILLGLINSATSPRVESNALATNVYLWGAQVVQGSIPKDYFFTTDRLNVPRLNYDSAGGCPSFLLEPQRTNKLLNSIWSGGGTTPTSWNSGFQTGISTPVTSIKNPNVSAYRFITSASQRQEFSQSFPLSSFSITCFSVYVESITTPITLFNLLRVGPTSGGTGTPTFFKNNIEILSSTNIEAGNTYTVQFNCTNLDTFQFRVGSGVNAAVAGDFVISMPQVEQGTSLIAYYSSSFIATTTTAVQRNSDTFTLSNVFTNGLITSVGGTWYVELINNILYTRDNTTIGLFLDSSAASFTNGFNIRNTGGSSRLNISSWQAGSGISLYTTLTDIVKIAIKWNGTTADVFVNSSKVYTGAFTPTTMEFLSGLTDVPKYIKSMFLFPTPLTDAEMTALTT